MAGTAFMLTLHAGGLWMMARMLSPACTPGVPPLDSVVQWGVAIIIGHIHLHGRTASLHDTTSPHPTASPHTTPHQSTEMHM